MPGIYNANENGYHYFMHDDPPRSPAMEAAADPALATPRHIRSEELFAGAREIVIEHHGRLYRMRITQNGKLILTA